MCIRDRNVARSRYKEQLDAGNWSLKLSGSRGTVTLIDDSGKKFSDTVGKSGRVFDVVQGTLNLGSSAEATITKKFSSGSASGSFAGGEGYGLFYPDLGIILLNADIVHASCSFGDHGGTSGVLQNSDSNDGNARKFFKSIKGGAYFQARREEKLSSTHYFVRAGNKEFNFSNNPTFFTSSTGDFTQPTFFKDPKVYITTVGLYNDSNELLAVAKLSQPVLKSYSREALIKVKLDF